MGDQETKDTEELRREASPSGFIGDDTQGFYEKRKSEVSSPPRFPISNLLNYAKDDPNAAGGDGAGSTLNTIFGYLINAAIVVVVLMVLIGISTMIYFFFYWIIMPKSNFEYPVYFDYDKFRVNKHSFAGAESCEFNSFQKDSVQSLGNVGGIDFFASRKIAEATVRLIGPQYRVSETSESLYKKANAVLKDWEKYDIFLEVDYYDSPVNQQTEVAMISMEILTGSNDTLVAESIRPFVPHYSHHLVRFARKMAFFPVLVTGLWKESSSFNLHLFEEFIENPKQHAQTVKISLSADKFLVKSARLQFFVRFGGIRWYLYHWFYTSAFVGISQITIGLAIGLVGLYFYNAAEKDQTSTYR